ncbi:MAG: hypothetical protein ACOC44_05795 [Promethearchaeia archaeon]
MSNFDRKAAIIQVCGILISKALCFIPFSFQEISFYICPAYRAIFWNLNDGYFWQSISRTIMVTGQKLRWITIFSAFITKKKEK